MLNATNSQERFVCDLDKKKYVIKIIIIIKEFAITMMV